jgi:hypothetical protein
MKSLISAENDPIGNRLIYFLLNKKSRFNFVRLMILSFIFGSRIGTEKITTKSNGLVCVFFKPPLVLALTLWAFWGILTRFGVECQPG